MDALALTDRDGTYGAVRFVKACMQGGVRPVLGVDLAVAPTGVLPPAAASAGIPGAPIRTQRASAARSASVQAPKPPPGPARGGTFRDRRLPRATFLAASKQGWAAICRLVSATHLAGERGSPVTTLDLVAEQLGSCRPG